MEKENKEIKVEKTDEITQPNLEEFFADTKQEIEEIKQNYERIIAEKEKQYKEELQRQQENHLKQIREILLTGNSSPIKQETEEETIVSNLINKYSRR